jgi:hypothetical protein
MGTLPPKEPQKSPNKCSCGILKSSQNLLGALVWFADTYHNDQDLNFNEITQQTEPPFCLRDCLYCNLVVNIQTTRHSQQNLTGLIHVKQNRAEIN